MKRPLSISFMLVLACFLVAMADWASAQPPTQHRPAPNCFGDCFYHAVLDRVFPLGEFNAVNERRRITIRVMPNSDPEWQIIIREKRDESFQLVYYQPPREGNVFSYIRRIVQTDEGAGDIDKLASGLRVDVKTIESAPPELARLIRGFLEMQIPTKFGGESRYDGTEYELWDEAMGSSLHAIIVDHNPAPGAKLGPLPEWMVKVTSLTQASLADAPGGAGRNHPNN